MSRRYLGEIQRIGLRLGIPGLSTNEDFALRRAIGGLYPRDIGKQAWIIDDEVIQVENDRQRARRQGGVMARKFERRHYVEIARWIREGLPPYRIAPAERRLFAQRIAAELHQDSKASPLRHNRPFDRAWFMKLCEVKP